MPGLSKSSLDLIHKSINHWLAGKRYETTSMAFGTAVHAAVLEPERWPRDFVKGPPARRGSKAWLEAEAEAAGAGLSLLEEDVWENVDRAWRAVYEHQAANRILLEGGGLAEGSVFVEDPDTGLLLKCRPDLLFKEKRLAVDLKTTKDSSPQSFARSCGTFRYDVQEAFYTDCLHNLFDGEWDFLFIAVENQEPFNVSVFQLDESDREYGRDEYRKDLKKLVDYYEKGGIPLGYSDGVNLIQIPGYMRRGD